MLRSALLFLTICCVAVPTYVLLLKDLKSINMIGVTVVERCLVKFVTFVVSNSHQVPIDCATKEDATDKKKK